MARIVKLAAAAIGAAGAVAGAALLHPRSGARRRAAVRRESVSVASRVGSAMDAPRRRWRGSSGLALAERARVALAAEFGSDADGLTLRAEKAVVTLRGEVEDIDDIALYEAAVRAVPGVADVDNLLRLRLVGMSRPRVLSA